MEVDEKGAIFNKAIIDTELPPTPSAVEVDDVPLPIYFPLKNIVEEYDSSKYVVFNPAMENITLGDSLILRVIRFRAEYIVRMLLSTAITFLVDLAATTSRHATLNPDQTEILGLLSEANKSVRDKVVAVMRKMGEPNSPANLVNMYLRRGDQAGIGKKKYSRVCVVRFPIMEFADKDATEIYGVQMTAKSRAALFTLLRYILPDIDKEDGYSAGNNDMYAPGLCAVMSAYAKMMRHFDAVYTRFTGVIPVNESIFDFRWESVVNDIASIRLSVLVYDHNEGDVAQEGAARRRVEEPQSAPLASSASRRPAQQEPAPQQQQVQPQGVQPPMQHVMAPVNANRPMTASPTDRGSNVVSMASIMGGNTPVQQQPVAPGGYLVSPQFGNNNYNGGYGGYNNGYNHTPNVRAAMQQPNQVINHNGYNMSPDMFNSLNR